MSSYDLAGELQKIYDGEINLEIGWLWDGGIEVRLGDKMSGYLAEEPEFHGREFSLGFKKRSRISFPHQRTHCRLSRDP